MSPAEDAHGRGGRSVHRGRGGCAETQESSGMTWFANNSMPLRSYAASAK